MPRLRFAVYLCLLGALCLPMSAWAQSESSNEEQQKTDQAKPAGPNAAPAAKSEAPKEKEKPEEPPVVTHHEIHVQGKSLKYTATAGLLPIKNDEGETEARMFFAAYTLDNPAGAGPAAPHLRIQRRAGLGIGLAAPGSDRSAESDTPARRPDAASALPAGGQSRHVA